MKRGAFDFAWKLVVVIADVMKNHSRQQNGRSNAFVQIDEKARSIGKCVTDFAGVNAKMGIVTLVGICKDS